MKAITIFLLLFVSAFCHATKNINLPLPSDTPVQKVYLVASDNDSFWNSNFWTSFFPFLIAAMSISALIYQNKKQIPSEADKIMLNERFKTHVELMDVLKDIITTQGNRKSDYQIHEVFQSINYLKSAHSRLFEFRVKNAVTLSLGIKKQLHILAKIFFCLLDYAETDKQLREIGIKHYKEVNIIFIELGEALAYFFEKEIRKQYSFPNLSNSEMEVLNSRVNSYSIIKETVGNIYKTKLKDNQEYNL